MTYTNYKIPYIECYSKVVKYNRIGFIRLATYVVLSWDSNPGLLDGRCW